MIDSKDYLLPIGTVVDVNNIKGKVVIIGFFPLTVDEENKKISVIQYVGCNYLDGYTSDEALLYFDEKDISNVYYMGYAIKFDFILLKLLHSFYDALKGDVTFEQALNAVLDNISYDKNKIEKIKSENIDYFFGEDKDG